MATAMDIGTDITTAIGTVIMMDTMTDTTTTIMAVTTAITVILRIIRTAITLIMLIIILIIQAILTDIQTPLTDIEHQHLHHLTDTPEQVREIQERLHLQVIQAHTEVRHHTREIQTTEIQVRIEIRQLRVLQEEQQLLQVVLRHITEVLMLM